MKHATQMLTAERLRMIGRRIRPWAPLIVLIIISVIIGQVNARFLTTNNFIRLARTASIPLVLSLGATFIILLGSIDLSIEGVMALSSVLVGLTVLNDRTDYDVGLVGALVVALGAGGIMGLINGIVHVRMRIPSFMATLGMSFVGVGMATVLISGIAVRVLDQNVRAIALDRFWDLPYAVWVGLGTLLITYIVQRFTRIGRYAYAIGGGEDLARLSGVPIERYKVIIFTFAGMLYGLGGLLAAAQLGQGNALIGQGRLFSAITAVVVGGTALSGGIGSVFNTLIGVLIVVVLDNGMVLMGVSPYYQQAVQGILIVIAVGLSLDRSQLKIVK
jgi:ribose transport system permease protein